MTFNSWCNSLKLLEIDLNQIKKDLLKLGKLHKKHKAAKFDALLEKTTFNLSYIKALYSQIRDQSYWHKEKMQQEKWEELNKEILFNLELIEKYVATLKEERG